MTLDNCPDFLTIKEVSELLRVGTSQVYILLRTNQIKSTKIGNKWRIPKESIIEYRDNILNQN